jgi:hypothetical protein
MLSCPLRCRQRTNDYFVSTWRQPSSHTRHIPQLLMTTTCNKASTLTCNTNCTKRTLHGDIWTAHVWYFISPTTTKEWGWVHAFRKRRGCMLTAYTRRPDRTTELSRIVRCKRDATRMRRGGGNSCCSLGVVWRSVCPHHVTRGGEGTRSPPPIPSCSWQTRGRSPHYFYLSIINCIFYRPNMENH